MLAVLQPGVASGLPAARKSREGSVRACAAPSLRDSENHGGRDPAFKRWAGQWCASGAAIARPRRLGSRRSFSGGCGASVSRQSTRCDPQEPRRRRKAGQPGGGGSTRVMGAVSLPDASIRFDRKFPAPTCTRRRIERTSSSAGRMFEVRASDPLSKRQAAESNWGCNFRVGDYPATSPLRANMAQSFTARLRWQAEPRNADLHAARPRGSSASSC
jgi:hypothetical protein